MSLCLGFERGKRRTISTLFNSLRDLEITKCYDVILQIDKIVTKISQLVIEISHLENLSPRKCHDISEIKLSFLTAMSEAQNRKKKRQYFLKLDF